MKRKTIILAVVAAAAMALSLVGCGVKITNIAVPDAVTTTINSYLMHESKFGRGRRKMEK